MKDSFGREITYLRLSVTELCNLRCRYCMPEEGLCKKPHDLMLTEDEMISAVEAAASLGVKKIRVTGGEPLVKKNILSICRRVSAVDGIRETCLTTNGTLLPQFAQELRDAGIDRLNISLDTLNAEKYAHITRRGSLEDALRGIETSLEVGFKKIKINAVLIGGFNDDEIADLALLTKRYPVDMRFIELMPMYDNEEFGPKAYVPCARVCETLPELEKMPHDGGVAELYRLPGAQGNIGLISAVSSHFCASCNRIRLTADGKLKPCLHSSQEYNIKGLTPEEMRETMREAITAKPACHVPLSASEMSEAGRSMNQIGG
ncbi:MAG: GTP 3',8-cyclase MoaA [Oscillospiraceae bacterium]|nr:GTP 3',8-cyclase MoaA [Oscillospiraceae bacterium]